MQQNMNEQMMRQNHAVLGDFVDFAVKQASVPFNPEVVSETTTAQVADATAVLENCSEHAHPSMQKWLV
jgi:hypothetical protein